MTTTGDEEKDGASNEERIPPPTGEPALQEPVAIKETPDDGSTRKRMVTAARLTISVSILTLVLAGVQVGLIVWQIRSAEKQAKDVQAHVEKQTKLAEEQAQLAKDQAQLSKRQLEIAQRQAEFFARRADLRLRIGEIKLKSGETEYQLLAKNHGDKKTGDFFWDLLIPSSSIRGSGYEHGREEGVKVEHGIPYRHFRGRFTASLHPKTETEVMRVTIANPAQGEGVWVLWRFMAEDGIFPAEGKFGFQLLAGALLQIPPTRGTDTSGGRGPS